MSAVRRLFSKIVNMYKRQDHIKYAKSLGVKVGKGSRFVDNPIWGSEPYLISIGEHVLISGRVTFLNHDGATILPNVTIGDNCIIAAGSMVTKNIPSGEVWGGIPAHFITKTEDYAKKSYENRLPYDPLLIQTDTKNEMLRVVGKENQKND